MAFPAHPNSRCLCSTLGMWEECRIGPLGEHWGDGDFLPHPRTAGGGGGSQDAGVGSGRCCPRASLALWAAAGAGWAPDGCWMSSRLGGEQELQPSISFFSWCSPRSHPRFPHLSWLHSECWVIQGLAYSHGQKTFWDQSEMLFQPVHPSDPSLYCKTFPSCTSLLPTVAGFTSRVTESDKTLSLTLPPALPWAIFFCNENNSIWEGSLEFLFCFIFFCLVWVYLKACWQLSNARCSRGALGGHSPAVQRRERSRFSLELGYSANACHFTGSLQFNWDQAIECLQIFCLFGLQWSHL